MFGKTPEYGFDFSCSLDRQPVAITQCSSGHAKKVLVECWLLLSGSPVEVGKSGRKTSTVVSDDTA